MEAGFVRVASVEDLPAGKAIAVRVANRSIALFNHEDKIYATDNQCPHMGYPLIRGRTRNGVLQCDWHGWSYALEGGGCFTGGCDDLDTFPVEVDNGDIYVRVAGVESKRTGAHYLLLKEGLLSADNWVLSKAVAIMLAQGVSEEETLRLLVEHLGKHIATEHDANGGFRLAQVMNGIEVAQRLDPDDRLIPLMMAATGASGRAGDRPEPRQLPDPYSWDQLVNWIHMFSVDRDWEAVEKCLVSARHLGECEDKIIPLMYECALAPHFLGFGVNVLAITYLAETVDRFGWGLAENLVCNLGAKILGRQRGTPQGIRREGMQRYREIYGSLDGLVSEPKAANAEFDEDAFLEQLLSGELDTTFDAITNAVRDSVHIDRIASAMALVAGDRMARTAVSFSPGWFDIGFEMQMAAAVRRIYRFAGYRRAVEALYHAAWQFYEDRWINIQHRSLAQISFKVTTDVSEPGELREQIIDAIESIRVVDAARLVSSYVALGHDTVELLNEVALTVLKHDSGWNLLHTLRTIFDELEHCKGHPASPQLLVGLVRFTTGVRRSDDNESATRTAKRFAQRQTAVDLY